MNDCQVSVTSVQRVLKQQAYILFYVRKDGSSVATSEAVPTKNQAAVDTTIKPVVTNLAPDTVSAVATTTNGVVSDDDEGEAEKQPVLFDYANSRLRQLPSWQIRPFE